MQRTKVFKAVPWVGGVNSSVDPGVLNPQELVIADNVVFSSTGARIKRESLEYLDPEIPVPTFRSSSTTTRTLKFAMDELVTENTAILVEGEMINVSGVANYEATDVEVDTVNDLGSGIYSITYTADSSVTETETAAGDITITRASSVISITDFWWFNGTLNDQILVYATDDFQLFTLDASGNRKVILPAEDVTPPTSPVLTIRTLPFSNKLIIFFSGLGNAPIIYDPSDESDKYNLLSEDAPDASFGFEHQQRLWVNDKTDPDRIHYSPPFDETTWQGFGDSGAMFVGAGDGDPVGILNGYKYKDLAVFSKKAKRYRMTGDSPENYFFELISEGLGNEGTMSIPVDETDVVFLSHRGIHSQAATDTYGDTAAAYLSAKIKPTFNSWSSPRLQYAQGTWIPELNSIAISVTEAGNTSQNAIWLYNISVQIPGEQSQGAWYRWPNISCQSLTRRYINSKYKLVMGTSDGRIIQAQNEQNFTDFETTGIPFRVKSGSVYVDGDPQTIKAFKRISLLYRPKGNFSFNVTTRIDNNIAQAFSFNQISGLDILGETFMLGSSLLGSSATLAPFSFSMDGLGRGIIIEITQPSEEEQIEVWGFMIEWEPAGLAQEVV